MKIFICALIAALALVFVAGCVVHEHRYYRPPGWHYKHHKYHAPLHHRGHHFHKHGRW